MNTRIPHDEMNHQYIPIHRMGLQWMLHMGHFPGKVNTLFIGVVELLNTRSIRSEKSKNRSRI